MPRLAMRMLPLPFLAAVLVAIPARLPAREPGSGRKVAFLVGVGSYKHRDKAGQLGTPPVNDVTAMAAVLRANGYSVILLRDEEATREAVMERFQMVLDGKQKPTDKKDALGFRDTLLVMLCGHGIQVEATIPNDPKDPERKDKQLQPFFQTHDSKPTDTDTMVPFNQLVRMAGENAVRTMFLVDACRSNTDPNQRGTRRVGITHGKAELPNGVSVLYSCSQGEEANQDERDDKNGHGLFTRAVLKVLRGETGLREEVSYADLVAAVNRGFRRDPAITAKIPMGRNQTPDAPQGPGSADVVLVTLNAPPAGDPKPGEEREVEIADGVKMTFCYIPKGKAKLGAPVGEKGRDSDDLPERDYEEKTGFWLGTYEVTQKQWEAAMGENPSYFSATGGGKEKVAGRGTAFFPVESVSFDDIYGKGWKDGGDPLAGSFLAKVNARAGIATTFGAGAKLRLPHEDRWEYAYQGGKGNTRAYYWGDEITKTEANFNFNVGRTTAVGEYKKAAPHPWGLCDMSGNAWELCENDHSKVRRVRRGGSWLNDPVNCRAAIRRNLAPTAGFSDIGFRVCVVID